MIECETIANDDGTAYVILTNGTDRALAGPFPSEAEAFQFACDGARIARHLSVWFSVLLDTEPTKH